MFIAGLSMEEDVRSPIYEGDPEDPNRTRVDLAARPRAAGMELAVTVRHL